MTRIALLTLAALLAGCTGPAPRPVDRAELRRQVADTERAFAKTMADRDHAAFTRFLSAETVFFSGKQPVRGAAAVAEDWKKFYAEPAAPFSWQPAEVEVLDSGTLALSSGPVYDPQGRHVANFMSIWRLEAPGTWRIVFDKGCTACAAQQ